VGAVVGDRLRRFDEFVQQDVAVPADACDACQHGLVSSRTDADHLAVHGDVSGLVGLGELRLLLLLLVVLALLVLLVFAVLVLDVGVLVVAVAVAAGVLLLGCLGC